MTESSVEFIGDLRFRTGILSDGESIQLHWYEWTPMMRLSEIPPQVKDAIDLLNEVIGKRQMVKPMIRKMYADENTKVLYAAEYINLDEARLRSFICNYEPIASIKSLDSPKNKYFATDIKLWHNNMCYYPVEPNFLADENHNVFWQGGDVFIVYDNYLHPLYHVMPITLYHAEFDRNPERDNLDGSRWGRSSESLTQNSQ